MIKFFRNIRKKLIEQGKTTNYLKYAIGEIVLVMIGILLALQVNNWNQRRINKTEERAILKNILEEIQLDTLDIGWNLSMQEQAVINDRMLLDFMMNGDMVPKDYIDYTSALGAPLISVLNTSTYISLISNNPDLITNQKLKKNLFRHYNQVYNAIMEAENKSQSFKVYDKLLPFFQKYFKPIPINKNINLSFKNSSEYFNLKFERKALNPMNLEVLKTDNEFQVALSEAILLRSIKISVYQDALKRIKELSNEIQTELDNNLR